jgi:hypothetical protein
MLVVASEQGGTIDLFHLDPSTGLPLAMTTTAGGVAPSRVVIGSSFP